MKAAALGFQLIRGNMIKKNLLKRLLNSTISNLLVLSFALVAWSGTSFGAEGKDSAKAGDLKNADELFYLNDVKYIKPKTFDVSQSFTEAGGMTRYIAAQDSQILKLVITPVTVQTAIPFEISKLKFYGDDGNISTGSFSTESISGSKGPQTDIVIICRSVLYKDGQTMIYLSYTIYAPINKTSKKVFVRFDDADLFKLDIEKLTLE
jgi:hypothetical protein